MAGTDTTVYECQVCGSEITITSEGMKKLVPLYCCGQEVKRKKAAPAKKKKASAGPVGKTARKSVKKAGTAKPAARKKK